jgi:hypothetical protein
MRGRHETVESQASTDYHEPPHGSYRTRIDIHPSQLSGVISCPDLREMPNPKNWLWRN